MENTNNLNLKKPDYTDFADIFDINDNMDTIDEKLHDTKDSVVAFTSSDVADGGASSWTNVTKVASGETHKSIFAKMSQMFKNIRFLYKLLGTKDISSIGDGTVTGGLFSLNDSFTNHGFNSAYQRNTDVLDTALQQESGITVIYFTLQSTSKPSDSGGHAIIMRANFTTILFIDANNGLVYVNVYQAGQSNRWIGWKQI